MFKVKRKSILHGIVVFLFLSAAFGIRLSPAPNFVAAQSAQNYTWRNVITDGGGGFVPGIIFNQSEANLIYARTDIGGAYRWNQSTGRWIPLLDWVGFDDWNLMGVDSLATDPVDPNRLYILAGTYTNEWTNMNGAILRSSDRGSTFQRTNLTFKSGGNMPGRSMGERLAIDPNRNGTLYLGARSGNGLWRSTDFAATWSKVTSFPNPGNFVQQPGDVYLGDNVGVVWVAFDPRSGTAGNTTQTIYVGVADKANSIYRSTNGGSTWAVVPGQPTGFLAHHGVLSAADGMLYVTYSDGAGPYDGGKGDVWKFNTASGAWTLISPVPSSSADDYFGYGGLAVDRQNPSTIMVSALNSWWPDTIIFRSTNGGSTWTRIWDWAGSGRSFRYVQSITAAPWLTFGPAPPPPEVTPKLGWMVGDLEIDPFNSNRMMYGTGATIYGSDDLTTWDTGGQIHISVKAQGIEETSVQELISPPMGALLLSAIGDVNGYRHTSLTSPPTTIFTTPTTASSTSIDYAEAMQNFIVRVGNVDKSLHPDINRCGFSFDGGQNWFQGQEPGGVTSGGTVAANANATRVVWSPDGTGVFWSSNNGSSWTQSTGIPNGARVCSDRMNPNKFYGFSNGTFYVSVNGGTSFTAAASGLPGFARIKAVFGRDGDIWLPGGEGGLWHSTNSGTTFTRITNVEEADNIGFGMAAPGQSYPALYSSAQIGGVRGIYRSDDAGATWIRINDDQHQYGSTGNAITGDQRVYGRVFFSTNGRGIIWGEPGTAGPDFSLSASPSSVTINRGQSGASTITITRTGGFTSSVAFSATGLPSGVTASFSPTSTTGGSTTVTLTASSTATVGSATIAITGTGGGLTRTTSIGLVVNPPPDFSLSASPASLTINRGASGTSNIAVTRTGGFTSSVAFSASGLPAGVTASFNPTPTTGNSSTLTLTASSTATTGPATVTVTGTGGGLTRTTTISLTVNAPVPDFSLSASPISLAINQGASGTSTVTVTRLNGFTSSVAFSATGLPAGVTAAFNPTSTTGTSTVLTLTASSTATAGPATVTVSGSGGGLTRTVAISVTINALTPDFSLTASPTSVTVAQGATATSTINITRVNGFTSGVTLSATGLPSGVTASFNPSPATGTTSTLTFTASATATTGPATATVTGTGGGLTRTASIALTVSGGTGGTGGVTVTPVVTANGQWFNEQQVRIGNTGALTALSITITIQRTTGVSFSGQYNTVGTQITQSNISTASTITYQFTLAAGQTLSPGTGYTFAAQMSGSGTVHPTAGDTYTVTYTTGGATFTQSGHF